MFIKSVTVKNFRGFDDRTFSFEKSFVVIEGANGTGKTSLLESLHYACYLRSFRTHRGADLLKIDAPYFFVGVDFESHETSLAHSIQVGCEEKKKTVKFDGRPIRSYQNIINSYRIISMSEHDMELVQGAPEARRFYLDALLSLLDSETFRKLKKYRYILSQRNTFLRSIDRLATSSLQSEYEIWTKQLWEGSTEIQNERIKILKELERVVNRLLVENFSPKGLSISFEYLPKNSNPEENFDSFIQNYKKSDLELKLDRSLFGAHLDDIIIHFQNKKARVFASRGQQKLILFLLKIAQLLLLREQGISAVLLLDDFITDFDATWVSECCKVLQDLSCQTFITSPLELLAQNMKNEWIKDCQLIKL
jgi:DNA replication and repair protein RecF